MRFGIPLLILLIASSLFGGSLELSVELYNPQENYLLREPVWVEIPLTNTGSDSVWAVDLMVERYFLKFLIRKDDGKVLPRVGIRGAYAIPETSNPEEWNKDWGFWLSPGESHSVFINLIEHYPMWYTDHYTIEKVTYHSWLPEYAPLWHGEIVIEPNIKVEVIEPVGEEANAHALLKRAGAVLESTGLERSVEEKIADYQRILHKFPHSCYVPFVLYQLGGRLNYIGNLNSAIETMEELIELFPDSPFVYKGVMWLMYYSLQAERKEKCIAIFERIRKKYPNSLLADAIRRREDDWSRGKVDFHKR